MDAFLHWLHLMAAVTWIGGMIFAAMILQPVMRRSFTPEVRMPLYRDIGSRFKAVQLACLGILLATGLQKLWTLRETPEVFHSAYGMILGVKLALVAAVSILSALHSYVWGPQLTALRNESASPAYAALMRKLVFWGMINLHLAFAIIFCAALLRFNPF